MLQFYGSNETGAVSATRPEDPPHKRLTTAGKPIPEMQLRLFDPDGRDVTASGRGQPAVKGPVVSRAISARRRRTPSSSRPTAGSGSAISPEPRRRRLSARHRHRRHHHSRWQESLCRRDRRRGGAPSERGPGGGDRHARPMGERAAAYVELRPGTALDLDALRAHLQAKASPVSLARGRRRPAGASARRRGQGREGGAPEDARKRFGEPADEDLIARSRAAERAGD